MFQKIVVVIVCGLITLTRGDGATNSSEEASPYTSLVLCVSDANPWDCVQDQSLKLISLWTQSLEANWKELEEDANRESEKNATARGQGSSREDPTSLMTQIQYGATQIKDFIEETADEFMGREEDYANYEDQSGEDNGGASFSEILHNYEQVKKKKPHHQLQQIVTPVLVHSEELAGLVTGHGHKKHGHKHGHKYPLLHKLKRSKKKKKKKALIKLLVAGAVVKSKIELLLKMLSAHLQVKFFAIALIGLFLNIGRFFLELKRGAQSHKVVYVEHAHHQHHYEDREDEWDQAHGGGYWRRAYFAPSPSYDEHSLKSLDDTYAELSRQDPQRAAYYRQVQQFK